MAAEVNPSQFVEMPSSDGSDHKQLVPVVYVQHPKSDDLIDSKIIKWGSKILLSIMTLVIVPICLATLYHANEKLEIHSETLAVIAQSQADMENTLSDLKDTLSSQVVDLQKQEHDDQTNIAVLRAEVEQNHASIETPESTPHHFRRQQSSNPLERVITGIFKPIGNGLKETAHDAR